MGGPAGVSSRPSGAWRWLAPIALVVAAPLDQLGAGLASRGYTPWADDAAVAVLAAQRADAVLAGDLATACCRLIGNAAPYPPLVTTVAGLFARTTGTGVPGLLASLALWTGLGAVGAAWMGARVVGPRHAAAGAAAAAAAWFLVARFTDEAEIFLDPAVGALGLLALAALDASEGLRRVHLGLVAGLAAGAALLAKFTAAHFLGPAMFLGLALGLARTAWAGPAAASTGRAAPAARPGDPEPGPPPPAAPADPARPSGRRLLRGVGALLVGAGTLAVGGLLLRWALGQRPLAPALAAAVAVAALVVALARGRGLAAVVGLLACAAGASVAAGFYLPNQPEILRFLQVNLAGGYAGAALEPGTGLRWLWRAVFWERVPVGVLGLWALGLAGAVWRREHRWLPHLGGAAVGAALIVLGPYQAIRYLAPMLALLSPLVVEAAPRRALPLLAGLLGLWVGLVELERLPAIAALADAAGLPPEAGLRPAPATDPVQVARWLDRPAGPPRLGLRLPPPRAREDSLARVLRRAVAACPPERTLLVWVDPTSADGGARIHLLWDLPAGRDVELGAHRHPGTPAAPPLELHLVARPGPGVVWNEGGWTVDRDTSSPECLR